MGMASPDGQDCTAVYKKEFASSTDRFVEGRCAVFVTSVQYLKQFGLSAKPISIPHSPREWLLK